MNANTVFGHHVAILIWELRLRGISEPALIVFELPGFSFPIRKRWHVEELALTPPDSEENRSNEPNYYFDTIPNQPQEEQHKRCDHPDGVVECKDLLR